MRAHLPLLPFALFLIILPFPGTVAARLLLLAICFGIALWQWWRHPGVRAPIPCKPVLGAWTVVCTASLLYAFDPGYSQGELKNELGYTMMAFFAFVITGFWPAIVARLAAASSRRLRSCVAEPTPMLITTFVRRGTAWMLSTFSSAFSAVTRSWVVLMFCV